MSSSLEKVKSIFKSPGIAAVLRWSGCVHLKVVLICMITVLATVCSLCFTLATKGLVDGAVSSKSDQLVRYALMLVGIILMQHLLANVRSWLRIHASAERLLELTELPAEEEGEVLHSFDEIVLDDITFKYDDGIEEVLQHVNWTIKRGDFMALTGISGGGKTSLFQLLLGIYKPTKGRMLFRAGGLEVPASRGTRALFAYVPPGKYAVFGVAQGQPDNVYGRDDVGSGRKDRGEAFEEYIGDAGQDLHHRDAPARRAGYLRLYAAHRRRRDEPEGIGISGHTEQTGTRL